MQAKDRGLEGTQAHRRAMMALVDGPGLTDETGRTLFSYAHPIFWAPFTVVGDGGGAGAFPGN
jgi:CHAT domain-containing protein